MKRISLVIITACALSLVSCGQDIATDKVPSVVQNAVQAKFSGASKVEWEKKKNYYEAEFTIDSIEHSLDIDAAGTVLLHKQEINQAALPAAVIAAVQKGYTGYTIDDADKIDKNGVILYEIELEAKGKKDVKVFFSPGGDITQL